MTSVEKDLASKSELTKLDLTPFKSGVIAVTGIGASFAAAAVVSGERVRRGCRTFPIRCADLGRGGLADCIVALSQAMAPTARPGLRP